MQFERSKHQLDDLKRKMADQKVKIEEKSKESKDVSKVIEKLELEIKEHEEMEVNANNDLRVFQSDMQNAEVKKTQLESENEWIKIEREHFGIRGHFYDFENMNLSDLSVKVKKLSREIED